MAWAICSSCGKDVGWSARRGVVLADLRCSCGGTLRGKTAGLPCKNKGKTFQTCRLCNKKRLRTRLVLLPFHCRPIFCGGGKEVVCANDLNLSCRAHEVEPKEVVPEAVLAILRSKDCCFSTWAPLYRWLDAFEEAGLPVPRETRS